MNHTIDCIDCVTCVTIFIKPLYKNNLFCKFSNGFYTKLKSTINYYNRCDPLLFRKIRKIIGCYINRTEET